VSAARLAWCQREERRRVQKLRW